MVPVPPPAPVAGDDTPGPEQGAGSRFLATVREDGLVAVIRGRDPEWAFETGAALMAAGVRVVEVTLTTPNATEVISRLREEAADDAWVGAGTVLTADDVARVGQAGAMFTVTPGWCAAVEASVEAHLPVVAGAWTPSEVYAAHHAGAAAVKVFPISSGGAAHLRALRDPLPQVPLIPVGGVELDDVAELRAAGAIAVGVGGSLTGRGIGESAEVVQQRARTFLEETRP